MRLRSDRPVPKVFHERNVLVPVKVVTGDVPMVQPTFQECGRNDPKWISLDRPHRLRLDLKTWLLPNKWL